MLVSAAVEIVGVPAEPAVKANLAFVTVPSLGVPIASTSPNTKIKSIESEDVKASENTIVEPDIV